MITNDSSTYQFLEELSRVLHAQRLTVVLADAITHGAFAFAASQHVRFGALLETSMVFNTAHSLKTVLNVDVERQPMDQLSQSVGVEMARNALDLSGASLAIALTQCSSKHIELPNCTVLGLHWWYKNRNNDMSSWMRSHQAVVISNRDELSDKLIEVVAHETIKVLRLQQIAPS